MNGRILKARKEVDEELEPLHKDTVRMEDFGKAATMRAENGPRRAEGCASHRCPTNREAEERDARVRWNFQR